MKSVQEIRRENLMFLIEQYGSIAQLNITLGRKRTDGTLSQIKNAAVNSQTNKARNMGAGVAREIERKLNLEMGWMDVEHDESQPFEPNSTDAQLMATTVTIPAMSTSLKIDQNLPFKGIQISQYFIDKVINLSNKALLKVYFIEDSSVESIATYGSLVLIDTECKEIAKDGVYLLKINDQIALRKVTVILTGGYSISSDLSASQLVTKEDLSKVSVLGKALYVWQGKYI